MNKLWTRFICYLNDGPFWQKRWWPVSLSEYRKKQSIQLPQYRHNGVSKAIDSRWREKARCVLMKSTGDRVCHLVYFDQHGEFGMRTVSILKTRLFAMRLTFESHDTSVFALDMDGEQRTLELVKDDMDSIIVGSAEQVCAYAMETYGEKVTLV